MLVLPTRSSAHRGTIASATLQTRPCRSDTCRGVSFTRPGTTRETALSSHLRCLLEFRNSSDQHRGPDSIRGALRGGRVSVPHVEGEIIRTISWKRFPNRIPLKRTYRPPASMRVPIERPETRPIGYSLLGSIHECKRNRPLRPGDRVALGLQIDRNISGRAITDRVPCSRLGHPEREGTLREPPFLIIHDAWSQEQHSARPARGTGDGPYYSDRGHTL